MYDIGSRAVVHEYVQYGQLPAPVPMFLSPGNHTCIQVLSLPSWVPDIWDVIALIKLLPLLSDLQTSYPGLGPMPDGITMDKFPEHIISNYAPIGRRFRFWNLNDGAADFAELATCMFLLALTCPNFDCVYVRYNLRFLMEQMDNEICSHRFKPYAPRLRCLLFKGWNGC